MPKQKRWAIKKKLEQADLACKKAQDYIVELGAEFQAEHPEYFTAFSGVVTALEKVREAIQQLSESI